ncbi:hypothetical protein ID875_19625 [Streptomyces globisporus]|uniref:HTH luxR-type domain-containing protein n=1 Tax=Streptomyces globisporus TaxID=1908 RepID=A0A927GNL6_STRGL|nr:hypothetical protein [Streptomyces globisporus]
MAARRRLGAGPPAAGAPPPGGGRAGGPSSGGPAGAPGRATGPQRPGEPDRAARRRGADQQADARRLGISPHTVNYHLKKLFQKTGVNSRIALLRETGWNDPSQESPEPGPRVRPRPGALEGGGQM